MSAELTTRKAHAVATTDDSPESILRFAMERGATVDVIERMMQVRRELKAERAKESFDAAMRDLQAEMPVIAKAKQVPDASGKVAYAYAPLEDIIHQIRPLLQRHGFSYTLDTDVESKDGWVIARCTVTHCAGHCHTSTAKFPLGTATRLMSQTQVYAAALTFASRRVFCNAFGIVTGGEDLDGQGPKPKPPGPSKLAPPETALRDLAVELWTILKPVRGTAKSWLLANQWMHDELVLPDELVAPDLTEGQFRAAISKAREKLK